MVAATLLTKASAPAELAIADCGTSVPSIKGSAVDVAPLPPPPHALNRSELAARLAAVRKTPAKHQ